MLNLAACIVISSGVTVVSRSHAVERIITNEPIDATDPGTPDEHIGNRRLLGRLAYRRAPEKGPAGQQDTDFWLGWLDERLRALYGR